MVYVVKWLISGQREGDYLIVLGNGQRTLGSLDLHWAKSHGLPHTNASIPKQPARKSHAPEPPSAGGMTRSCSLGKACSLSVRTGGHGAGAFESKSGFGDTAFGFSGLFSAIRTLLAVLSALVTDLEGCHFSCSDPKLAFNSGIDEDGGCFDSITVQRSEKRERFVL